MALAFAVSVESDRADPAIGIPAVFVLLNYLAFAIGSIWPDMRWLEDYSMFNLLKAQDVLSGGAGAQRRRGHAGLHRACSSASPGTASRGETCLHRLTACAYGPARRRPLDASEAG